MFGEPSRDYRRLTKLLRKGRSVESINLDLLFRVSAEGYILADVIRANSPEAADAE